MEGENDKCEGTSVIIFCEKLDETTVSFRLHNNITDQDIILVQKKLQFIFEEYENEYVFYVSSY